MSEPELGPATCDWCDQPMAATSCTAETYDIAGKTYRRLPVDPRRCPPHGRCRDCDAPAGGFHHPGCDVERCPRCGWQAIGCDCEEISDATAEVLAALAAEEEGRAPEGRRRARIKEARGNR